MSAGFKSIEDKQRTTIAAYLADARALKEFAKKNKVGLK